MAHDSSTPHNGPSIRHQARRHLQMTRRLRVGIYKKSFLFLTILGLTLYAMLFSTTPLVHDFFHEFRHNLMLVPCH